MVGDSSWNKLKHINIENESSSKDKNILANDKLGILDQLWSKMSLSIPKENERQMQENKTLFCTGPRRDIVCRSPRSTIRCHPYGSTRTKASVLERTVHARNWKSHEKIKNILKSKSLDEIVDYDSDSSIHMNKIVKPKRISQLKDEENGIDRTFKFLKSRSQKLDISVDDCHVNTKRSYCLFSRS